MNELINKNTYHFFYYFDKKLEEKDIVINAENREQAIKKFYDIVGIAQFGCIDYNGNFFTDDDYEETKIIMENGC